MARRPIAGCRALVTGASGGIGRSLALELARRGANLVLVARREARLRQLCDEVMSLGPLCETVVGDITVRADREQAINRARIAYGGLDLLVNNAGVGAVGPFETAAPERMRQVMELNVFALAEMTRLAIPLLKRSPQAMIVNIGSILGQRAVPGSSEYCASKFAVRGFSQSLRAELKPHGIEVLLASPAGTESEFWVHLVDGQGDSTFRGRPVSAEKTARRIVRAIERGRREVFPSLTARVISCADRFAPRLVEWLIMRRYLSG